ncbi:MAG: hypothetical protein Q8R86_03505 [Sulfuricurvum sp.]|nr:hypothetical protein [Sulfuricurvum sp.]
MDLVDFAWDAVAGNAFYDSVKLIFGGSFGILKDLVNADKKDDFSSHLQTIFSVNKEIQKQLEELKQNGEININSGNTVVQNGDNNRVKIG